MCQQIVQFCTGSTKPLLFAGGFLSILLAIAIGYTGCTTNALYNDIDPQVASANSLGYHLQLAAATYLAVVTIFGCYAAHYDQKHSIRALAFITTLNFVLAVVAILLVPPGANLGKQFVATLERAQPLYNFTDLGPVVPAPEPSVATATLGDAAVLNSTRNPRWAEDPAKAAAAAAAPVRELNATTATEIWNRLQARGCCGIRNATEEWKSKLPRTCCSNATMEGAEKRCKELDPDHKQGCLVLIESTGLNLIIVLALIALVNFYLALITSISAYRTFHYDEASQSAYT